MPLHSVPNEGVWLGCPAVLEKPNQKLPLFTAKSKLDLIFSIRFFFCKYGLVLTGYSHRMKQLFQTLVATTSLFLI